MAWREVAWKNARVTNALAKKWAAMDKIGEDRGVREVRMRIYEKIARAGQFRRITWAAAKCLETGIEYRVNGQHTSTLFALLPMKELPPVNVLLEWYECDTMLDVSALHATFDSKLAARNVRDINGAFASAFKDLEGIKPREIDALVASVWYAKLQSGYFKVPAHERAEAMADHLDFFVWATSTVGYTSTTQHVFRVPVVAAMHLAYQKDKKAATEFWRLVVSEEAPKPADPTRKLAKFLMTHWQYNRHDVARKRDRADDREFFVRSLHAWNAWRTKVPTEIRYYADAAIPAVK